MVYLPCCWKISNENNLNDVSAYTFSHAFTYGGNNTTAGGSVPLGIVGISVTVLLCLIPLLALLESSIWIYWIASDAFGMYNPGSDTAGGRPNINDQYHYIDANFLLL